MHNLNRQVLVPQDTMSLQTHASALSGNDGTSIRTQQLVGFFAPNDRPKHDSRWPQVGQTFTKPLYGNLDSNVRRCKSDNPWGWPHIEAWEFRNEHLCPHCGVNPSFILCWVGEGLWVNLHKG